MLRRAGRADEVGGTAVWLAAEHASSFITGQIIPVDGGLLLVVVLGASTWATWNAISARSRAQATDNLNAAVAGYSRALATANTSSLEPFTVSYLSSTVLPAGEQLIVDTGNQEETVTVNAIAGNQLTTATGMTKTHAAAVPITAKVEQSKPGSRSTHSGGTSDTSTLSTGCARASAAPCPSQSAVVQETRQTKPRRKRTHRRGV